MSNDEDEVEGFITIAAPASLKRAGGRTVSSEEICLYPARITAVLEDGSILAHSTERILHEIRHWCLPGAEGVRWIHGKHSKNTVEGAALLVAFALKQQSE